MIDAGATAVLPSPGAPMAWAMETSSRHERLDYNAYVVHVPGLLRI
jgi:hypothetical protein